MTIQTREQSESGKGAVRVRLRRFPRCRRGDTSLGTTTRSDRQEVEGLDGGSWSMLVVVVVLLLHRQRDQGGPRRDVRPGRRYFARADANLFSMSCTRTDLRGTCCRRLFGSCSHTNGSNINATVHLRL